MAKKKTKKAARKKTTKKKTSKKKGPWNKGKAGKVLGIPFPPDEYKLIQEQAKHLGMKSSEWGRHVIRNKLGLPSVEIKLKKK